MDDPSAIAAQEGFFPEWAPMYDSMPQEVPMMGPPMAAFGEEAPPEFLRFAQAAAMREDGAPPSNETEPASPANATEPAEAPEAPATPAAAANVSAEAAAEVEAENAAAENASVPSADDLAVRKAELDARETELEEKARKLDESLKSLSAAEDSQEQMANTSVITALTLETPTLTAPPNVVVELAARDNATCPNARARVQSVLEVLRQGFTLSPEELERTESAIHEAEHKLNETHDRVSTERSERDGEVTRAEEESLKMIEADHTEANRISDAEESVAKSKAAGSEHLLRRKRELKEADEIATQRAHVREALAEIESALEMRLTKLRAERRAVADDLAAARKERDDNLQHVQEELRDATLQVTARREAISKLSEVAHELLMASSRIEAGLQRDLSITTHHFAEGHKPVDSYDSPTEIAQTESVHATEGISPDDAPREFGLAPTPEEVESAKRAIATSHIPDEQVEAVHTAVSIHDVASSAASLTTGLDGAKNTVTEQVAAAGKEQEAADAAADRAEKAAEAAVMGAAQALEAHELKQQAADDQEAAVAAATGNAEAPTAFLQTIGSSSVLGAADKVSLAADWSHAMVHAAPHSPKGRLAKRVLRALARRGKSVPHESLLQVNGGSQYPLAPYPNIGYSPYAYTPVGHSANMFATMAASRVSAAPLGAVPYPVPDTPTAVTPMGLGPLSSGLTPTEYAAIHGVPTSAYYPPVDMQHQPATNLYMRDVLAAAAHLTGHGGLLEPQATAEDAAKAAKAAEPTPEEAAAQALAAEQANPAEQTEEFQKLELAKQQDEHAVAEEAAQEKAADSADAKDIEEAGKDVDKIEEVEAQHAEMRHRESGLTDTEVIRLIKGGAAAARVAEQIAHQYDGKRSVVTSSLEGIAKGLPSDWNAAGVADGPSFRERSGRGKQEPSDAVSLDKLPFHSITDAVKTAEALVQAMHARIMEAEKRKAALVQHATQLKMELAETERSIQQLKELNQLDENAHSLHDEHSAELSAIDAKIFGVDSKGSTPDGMVVCSDGSKRHDAASCPGGGHVTWQDEQAKHVGQVQCGDGSWRHDGANCPGGSLVNGERPKTAEGLEDAKARAAAAAEREARRSKIETLTKRTEELKLEISRLEGLVTSATDAIEALHKRQRQEEEAAEALVAAAEQRGRMNAQQKQEARELMRLARDAEDIRRRQAEHAEEARRVFETKVRTVMRRISAIEAAEQDALLAGKRARVMANETVTIKGLAALRELHTELNKEGTRIQAELKTTMEEIEADRERAAEERRLADRTANVRADLLRGRHRVKSAKEMLEATKMRTEAIRSVVEEERAMAEKQADVREKALVAAEAILEAHIASRANATSAVHARARALLTSARRLRKLETARDIATRLLRAYLREASRAENQVLSLAAHGVKGAPADEPPVEKAPTPLELVHELHATVQSAAMSGHSVKHTIVPATEAVAEANAAAAVAANPDSTSFLQTRSLRGQATRSMLRAWQDEATAEKAEEEEQKQELVEHAAEEVAAIKAEAAKESAEQEKELSETAVAKAEEEQVQDALVDEQAAMLPEGVKKELIAEEAKKEAAEEAVKEEAAKEEEEKVKEESAAAHASQEAQAEAVASTGEAVPAAEVEHKEEELEVPAEKFHVDPSKDILEQPLPPLPRVTIPEAEEVPEDEPLAAKIERLRQRGKEFAAGARAAAATARMLVERMAAIRVAMDEVSMRLPREEADYFETRESTSKAMVELCEFETETLDKYDQTGIQRGAELLGELQSRAVEIEGRLNSFSNTAKTAAKEAVEEAKKEAALGQGVAIPMPPPVPEAEAAAEPAAEAAAEPAAEAAAEPAAEVAAEPAAEVPLNQLLRLLLNQLLRLPLNQLLNQLLRLPLNPLLRLPLNPLLRLPLNPLLRLPLRLLLPCCRSRHTHPSPVV
jgi:hypothetical protein